MTTIFLDDEVNHHRQHHHDGSETTTTTTTVKNKIKRWYKRGIIRNCFRHCFGLSSSEFNNNLTDHHHYHQGSLCSITSYSRSQSHTSITELVENYNNNDKSGNDNNNDNDDSNNFLLGDDVELLLSSSPFSDVIVPTSSSTDNNDDSKLSSTSTTSSSSDCTALVDTDNNNNKEEEEDRIFHNLNDLPNDIQIHIISFLAIKDGHNMIQVQKQYFNTIMNSNILWEQWLFQRYYHLLLPSNNSNNNHHHNHHNRCSLTFVVDKEEEEEESSRSRLLPKFAKLYQCAAPIQQEPTGFFISDLYKRRAFGSAPIFRAVLVDRNSSTSSSSSSSRQQSQSPTIVKCLSNDRIEYSIQANAPLPRPLRRYCRSSTSSACCNVNNGYCITNEQDEDNSSIATTSSGSSCSNSTYTTSLESSNNNTSSIDNTNLIPICSNNNTVQQHQKRLLSSSSHNIRQPFVLPYIQDINKVVITPRLVSYFEVTILQDQQQQQQQSLSSSISTYNRRRQEESMSSLPLPLHPQPPAAQHNNNIDDNTVIAIGLSTKNFARKRNLPGWDANSFGYHSDDGMIYHNATNQLQQQRDGNILSTSNSTSSTTKHYGPSFGKGDTIGCGIHYHTNNGGIFYTLNGTFLGYAWTYQQLQKDTDISIDNDNIDLYPTIGVDYNDPIEINFGYQKQFQFNLSQFIASTKQQ